MRGGCRCRSHRPGRCRSRVGMRRAEAKQHQGSTRDGAHGNACREPVPMRARPSRPRRHACPRPRHDARADDPAQTGDCAHMPSIQRPCGRQQPAFRRRTPRGQPAGHAPRADPLGRRRHHDRRGDGTAAGRRVCGFPARRRHQIHAARFPWGAAHCHWARGRTLARTRCRARFGRGPFPRRHLARIAGGGQAIHDFGVPAALAVQGICGRWGQTIHERILSKGAAAADPAGSGASLNQVCEAGSRIGTSTFACNPRRKPHALFAKHRHGTHKPVCLPAAIVGCRTPAKTA